VKRAGGTPTTGWKALGLRNWLKESVGKEILLEKIVKDYILWGEESPSRLRKKELRNKSMPASKCGSR